MLDESFVNNTWLNPLYDFFLDIFSSIFPISSSIYSLLYMLTHRRKIMESELASYTIKSERPYSGTATEQTVEKDQFQGMLDFEENLELISDYAEDD